MNPDTFDDYIGRDEALSLAHVKLHSNNGRVTVFPQEAIVEEDFEGNTTTKFKSGKAVASGVVENTHNVIISYVVPEDTEGLTTAQEISALDLNFGPLVLSDDQLRDLDDTEHFTYPEHQLLRRHPMSKEPSSRSTKREKKRAQEGKQLTLDDDISDKDIVQRMQDIGIQIPDEMATDLETAAETADQNGIPIWDELLSKGKLSDGRPRAKSLSAYRDATAQDVDRTATTASLRQTAKEHVAETQLALGGLIQPDGDQVIAELHKFIHKRPHCLDEDGQLLPHMASQFRDWLLYSRHWMISLAAVENVVLKKHLLVSTGLIPVTALRRSEETEEQARSQTLKDLPEKKKNNQKVKYSEMSEAERIADRNRQLEEKATAFRRIAPLIQNVHELPAQAEKFKQDEEGLARLTAIEHPNVRSFLSVRHDVHYLDETVPDEQPRYIARIEFTHNNTSGPRTEGQRDIDYVSTHRVVDVTDPKNHSSLEKMFPHTAHIKNYYHDLYGTVKISEHRLYLVSIHLNGQPCTTNLLTCKKNVPPLIKDLRIIAKIPSMVFILIRGTGVPAQIEGVVDRFKNLVRKDPLNDFFVTPQNPSLSHKGIKPMEELPKFTALPQLQFETWPELLRQTLLASVLELRFSIENQRYKAKAAIVPVPGTFKKDAGVFMAYHVQATVFPDPSKPRLMPGDAVQVDLFYKPEAHSASENAWYGKVIDPTPATAMGMINIVIDRPRVNNSISDTKEYSTLTQARLSNMSVLELVQWTTENCNQSIMIFTRNNDKECKRVTGNIRDMEVPEKLQDIYQAKDQRLALARQLLLCGDHTQFPAVPMYLGLEPQYREAAIKYIRQCLRPHQLSQFNEWVENGISVHTIWLTGPSGSGKTYLAILTLLPYIGNVEVKVEVINILKHEKDVQFQLKLQKQKAKEEDRKKAEEESKMTPEELAAAAAAAAAPEDNKSKKGKGKEKAKVDVVDPEKSTETVIEPGRITIAAMQNEAVDSLYLLVAPMAREYAKQMKLPRPLVLRLHGSQTELNAVKAMARPTYNPNATPTHFNVDPSVNVTKETPRALLAAYIQAFSGGSPGIPDQRFKQLEGSAAKYIMELARFDTFDASPELLAAFSKSERDDLAVALQPIIVGHQNMRLEKAEMTREIAVKIASAARIGLDALIERASIICTTVAVATKPSFNMTRRAHAVALEEAGRAPDGETMGFCSRYWNASLRMFIGATNQLHPFVMGDKKVNPFHKHAATSTIARMEASGGNVSRLEASSRFRNQELFDLCATVNRMPLMKPVEGAFNEELTKKYADINERIWGIKANFVIINTRDVKPQRDANRSTFCPETAAVAIKDAVERLQYMEGKDHAIITPYVAQRTALRRQRDLAAYLARSRGNFELARKLMEMLIETIDSVMGNDRSSIAVDTAGVVGHIIEEGRAVVATTRARDSQVFIAETFELTIPTSKMKTSHPLAKIIRQMDSLRRIKALSIREIQSLEQYPLAVQAAGLGKPDDHLIFQKASTAAAIIYNEADHDDDELEIMKIMRNAQSSASAANATDAWGSGNSDGNNAGTGTDTWGSGNFGGDNSSVGGWGTFNTGNVIDTEDKESSSHESSENNNINAGLDLEPKNDDKTGKDITEDSAKVDDFDWATLLPGNPYKNCVDETSLIGSIMRCFDDSDAENVVYVADTTSAIFKDANPDTRIALARLVNHGRVSVKVADAVLEARDSFKLALEYLLVMKLLYDCEQDTPLTYAEYCEQVKATGILDAYDELTANDAPTANDEPTATEPSENPSNLWGILASVKDIATPTALAERTDASPEPTIAPDNDFYKQDGSEPDASEDDEEENTWDVEKWNV